MSEIPAKDIRQYTCFVSYYNYTDLKMSWFPIEGVVSHEPYWFKKNSIIVLKMHEVYTSESLASTYKFTQKTNIDNSLPWEPEISTAGIQAVLVAVTNKRTFWLQPDRLRNVVRKIRISPCLRQLLAYKYNYNRNVYDTPPFQIPFV